MRPGNHKSDSESSPGPSFDGSLRIPGSASARTPSTTSSKFIPTSKRVYKVLKEYSSKLVDFNIFQDYLEDWVKETLCSKAGDGDHCYGSPFLTDELSMFDLALEGVFFQQLLRMPYTPYSSGNLKEDEFLAFEDFLYTAAEGLWHTFWHKNKPFPYFVACPRYPRSKFYTVEKAVSRGRLGGLSGVALMSKSKDNLHARWDDVVHFMLFKQNLFREFRLSPSVLCEALFYGVHILFSRSLSKYNAVTSDFVLVSIMDSRFGGVVKLGGDLGKLEVDSNNVYKSMAEWITCHADIAVSPVEQIWNKLGNVNWGDLGSVQILLAIFYSVAQWNGPPRKSLSSAAANHSLRLQKRRMETRPVKNGSFPSPVGYQHDGNYSREIVEHSLEKCDDLTKKGKGKGPRLNLTRGEVLVLEDLKEGCLKSFQIQEFVYDGSDCSYTAVSTECHSRLLTLLVGAHPSQLEPSWEDMNLWYQVQRQTKVLNVLKEHGVSSKHLPEIIASGRIMHSGACQKQSPKGRCDHPWCGTPILVTCPVGEPLLSLIAHDGPFSPEEATRCCRDCLAALRSARMANVLHGDIRPENVVRLIDERGSRGDISVYVLLSWGRAVLEDRDSPALNLQFSSSHALQHGKLGPSSDIESLMYLVYFMCGGSMPQQDSIESALKWRERCWAKRIVQQRLGEVSPLLKALADYVDSIIGTPYAVDYDVWLKRLDRGLAERGKTVEIEDDIQVAESSCGNSL
ncbi:uncharacterized protein LOC127241917 isoform X2 [Andrographis paniculata]|uniref:uncharacterized protein LOC127241917 isoform X2 n=1 Tax=Andrographis paniculata TaxID=175694 RepID=UPI0021E76D49|nr:uncharacterized protein LOC127241917 isoform X2 [Andrographis paniculata]